MVPEWMQLKPNWKEETKKRADAGSTVAKAYLTGLAKAEKGFELVAKGDYHGGLSNLYEGVKLDDHVGLYIVSRFPLLKDAIVGTLDEDESYLPALMLCMKMSNPGKKTEVDRIEEMKKAIRLNPTEMFCHSLLVSMHIQEKQFGLALEVAEKAKQVDPQFAMVYFQAGYCYSMLDRQREAIPQFQHFLEHVPLENDKYVTACEELVMLYKNDIFNARRYYDNLLEAEKAWLPCYGKIPNSERRDSVLALGKVLSSIKIDPVPTVNTPCDNCKANPGKATCAACKIKVYCSKECQRADWPAHREQCKRLQPFLKK